MKTALPELEIITETGKPVSVILPIKKYQEILDASRTRRMSPG